MKNKYYYIALALEPLVHVQSVHHKHRQPGSQSEDPIRSCLSYCTCLNLCLICCFIVKTVDCGAEEPGTTHPNFKKCLLFPSIKFPGNSLEF